MRPFRFADGTLWSCEAGEAGERVSGRRAAQTRLETQSGTVAGEKAGVCPKTAQRPKKSDPACREASRVSLGRGYLDVLIKCPWDAFGVKLSRENFGLS